MEREESKELEGGWGYGRHAENASNLLPTPAMNVYCKTVQKTDK